MHPIKKLILVILLGLFVVTPVSAEWFFGAKAGPMLIDVGGVSDTTNVGVMVGYGLGVGVGDLALEGEITTTVDKGDFLGFDVEVDTQALYLAFRTAGPIYFKVKGGFVNEKVTIGSISETDTGVSYGIGLGFGIGIAQLELEVTTIEEDVVFFSVGVQF